MKLINQGWANSGNPWKPTDKIENPDLEIIHIEQNQLSSPCSAREYKKRLIALIESLKE